MKISLPILPVFPLDGAIEMLADLGLAASACPCDHRANRHLQMEKMKKAGIDSQFLVKLSCLKKGIKSLIIKDCGRAWILLRQKCLCAETAFLSILLPARELGFKTVQMQWGRGLELVRI